MFNSAAPFCLPLFLMIGNQPCTIVSFISNSTEILTLSTGIVSAGGNLNVGRGGHGMGILRIKGIPKLAVFGGHSHQTKTGTPIVEVWNDDTETWHTAEDIKSSECLYKCLYQC